MGRRLRSFFSFPDPVNEIAARLVAAGVLAIAVSAIALSERWLAVVLLAGFLLRVAWGPRFDPLALLVTRVLVPALGDPQRPVPGHPKRFAQALGAAMSAVAVVLAFAFGAQGPAMAVLGVLAAAAFLEAAFAFCLGCKLYALLVRIGLVDDPACELCVNPELRAAG